MEQKNPNTRLEAFCDGVFAIALTLLIIDVKIPSTVEIHSNSDFWIALKHISPSIYAFILSFGIILITWVNHHHTIKLVNKSSPPFIYANGFLLLTVVLVPFPTALLGEHLFTEHSGPAVMLYCLVMVFQAVGWNLISGTTLKPGHLLTKNEKSTLAMRDIRKNSYFAFTIYFICAVVSFWFPLTIAMLLSLLWIFWLIYGINIKDE
jgi:uncharacterized membrane protein